MLSYDCCERACFSKEYYKANKLNVLIILNLGVDILFAFIYANKYYESATKNIVIQLIIYIN